MLTPQFHLDIQPGKPVILMRRDKGPMKDCAGNPYYFDGKCLHRDFSKRERLRARRRRKQEDRQIMTDLVQAIL